MAGQANDSEKLPWLEPYREPEPPARRPAKPARLKPAGKDRAAKPRPAASVPAEAPSSPRKSVPLAAWLATAVVVVAMAAGGGYWAGNRTAPPAPTPAPTVTIPVAMVDPIPMPEVETPSAAASEAEPTRQIRPAPKATSPRKAVRRPARRAASSSPPSRPDAAPPLPKAMSVSLIPQGSAGPPGTVVDLGRYLSPQLADSAFRVTAGRYPYLAGLKRVVVPLPPVYGQPRLYALQVGAKSSREARILCENLIKIGRPCDVR